MKKKEWVRELESGSERKEVGEGERERLKREKQTDSERKREAVGVKVDRDIHRERQKTERVGQACRETYSQADR